MYQDLLRRIFFKPLMNERGAVGEKEDDGKEKLPSGVEDLSETDKLLIEAGYTADELEDLSDEEKGGLLLQDKDTEEQDETEAKADDKEALEAIAADEKPPEGKADEKPVETIEATDEQLLSFRPVVTAEELPKVEISKEVPAEFQTKLDELDTKYDEGEMSLKEYNKERDAINRDIYEVQANARDAAKEAVSTARGEKEAEKIQGHFLVTRGQIYLAPKDADPKVKMRSDALYGAFGKMVEAISLDPKTASLGWMETLIMADKAVRETFNIGKGAPPKGEEKPVAGRKPAAPKPDIVTLRDIPQAQIESVDGDPFAGLDKLTGEAYEKALEKLTEAQQEAYINGASKPSRRRVA